MVKQTYFTINLLCILLMILSWISVNIYLPALPKLVTDFHTSAANLKLSLTLFFSCFALSQLIWGTLSEKYGRKKPLLAGMVLTSIGVLMAMSAHSVTLFNLGRVTEAIGLGCAPVLGRAILSDVLDKVSLSITWAYATITANIMPALAPIIGGHLLVWFGWRSIFLFLLIYSLSLYFSTYRNLPETHAKIQHDLRIKHALHQYWYACTHREFIGFLLPYVLATGAMIGYYAMTPFIFITRLGIAPDTYGYLSLVTVITYIAGAVIARFLSPYLESGKLVILGSGVGLIAAAVMIIIAIFLPISVLSVLIPMAIFTFSAGLISPGSNAGALAALRHLAGAGSAIAGTTLYASSAIFSSIATALPLKNLTGLAIYITIVAILAFASFYWLVNRAKAKNI